MQDTLQIIVGALGTEVPGGEGSLEISLDSILGILDDLIIVSLPICHRIDLEHMPVTMVDQKTSEGPTTVKQRNKSGEFKVCW